MLCIQGGAYGNVLAIVKVSRLVGWYLQWVYKLANSVPPFFYLGYFLDMSRLRPFFVPAHFSLFPSFATEPLKSRLSSSLSRKVDSTPFTHRGFLTDFLGRPHWKR